MTGSCFASGDGFWYLRMLKVGRDPANYFPPGKPTHRIYLARGENIRTVFLRPWLVATLATIGITFLALYLAATGYLVFRDDLLTASISRQNRIQHAYEDRIASLRADIDRITSRQLLDQRAFDEKLDKLLARQTALDARQDFIAGLSQAARRVGLDNLAVAPEQPDPASTTPAGPAATDPLITGSIAPVESGRHAMLAIAQLEQGSGSETADAAAKAGLASLEASLDRLANEQTIFVTRIAEKVGRRADRIFAALSELGHPDPTATLDKVNGVGGPFVPLAPGADPETFRNGVAIVTAEIERLSAAQHHANQLPLANPVTKVAISSRFGKRLDPFNHRPAFHTGLDFRARSGYPVRATASGKVLGAKYTGGYGKTVEIDHGNGVTTRYSHLSRIAVKRGDLIAKGDIVGGAGSTGRSTGPHLHYEIRINGKAIDPILYIRAGREITPLL
jgi:murein DD-endopeptidase MepM/ murein hydrolase activator NlpD